MSARRSNILALFLSAALCAVAVLQALSAVS